jgi:hypothetical protein
VGGGVGTPGPQDGSGGQSHEQSPSLGQGAQTQVVHATPESLLPEPALPPPKPTVPPPEFEITEVTEQTVASPSLRQQTPGSFGGVYCPGGHA